jgi:hypothetical protein
VVKHTTEIAKWCKLIAIAACAGVVCNGPIFPQLIAQIAALDHDHAVRLSASEGEVRLILRHGSEKPGPDIRDSGASLTTAQEPPHVIIIPAGSTMVKQTASVGSDSYRTIAAMFDEVCVRGFDSFVTQPVPLHSRPPPDEMSISRFVRNTQLLI